jgi:MazG family protein
MQPKASLDDTLALMRDLRARCEWDAAQTHESLRPYLIEESHELDDALREGDDDAIRQELGDVLLQVLFHSVVAEERGAFDIGDVAQGLISKMRARHPHLYGDGEKRSWEQMKARTRSSITEGLPSGLPALHRAHRLQDRAAGVGFDWPDAEGPLAKVAEELDEVRAVIGGEATASPEGGPFPPDDSGARRDALEAELGDLLFAVVNLCRKLDVHAGLALDRANEKFVRRFSAIEELARARGQEPRDMTLEELEALWDEVKRSE